MGKEILTEDDFQLRTSEPLSNATVLAISEAKGEFGATLPVHIKCIRLGEDIFIAIPGLGGSDYSLASFNLLQMMLISIRSNNS